MTTETVEHYREHLRLLRDLRGESGEAIEVVAPRLAVELGYLVRRAAAYGEGMPAPVGWADELGLIGHLPNADEMVDAMFERVDAAMWLSVTVPELDDPPHMRSGPTPDRVLDATDRHLSRVAAMEALGADIPPNAICPADSVGQVLARLDEVDTDERLDETRERGGLHDPWGRHLWGQYADVGPRRAGKWLADRAEGVEPQRTLDNLGR